jgi:hypothetical protein
MSVVGTAATQVVRLRPMLLVVVVALRSIKLQRTLGRSWGNDLRVDQTTVFTTKVFLGL